MKILLIEDNQDLADIMQQALTSQHYLVDVATDGQTGLCLANLFEYDLILLDLMLPDLTGDDFCKQRRESGSSTPILVITGEDSSSAKVNTLDAGADDYLVKPFQLDELFARIRALIRRGKSVQSFIEWQGLCLEANSYIVTYNKKPLSLSQGEYILLELFLHNQNRIFSQSALIEHFWSYDEMPSEREIKGYIESLKLKLKQVGAEGRLIDTVYGLGYRLTPKNSLLNDTLTNKIDLDSLEDKFDNISKNPSVPIDRVSDIFNHYQQYYYQKIRLLEEAVKALENHSITDSLRQQAINEAHTLSGSLGLFGFKIAANKCRQLEKILKTGDLFDSIIINYINRLVSWLRQEIEQETQSPIITQTPPQACILHTPYILIVDDDVPLTEILTSEAHSWGMEAKAAYNLSEARKAIADKRPDLVILDLYFHQTEENGLDLLAELTMSNPPIPVIVSTVEDGLMDRLKVVQSGAQAFLHKPVTPEQVMEAITHLLRYDKAIVGKLMIVDDDRQVLEFLRHLLEPWGFILTQVEDSLKFWDSLEQANPDLLILDLEMPGFSGIDLCQIVRNDPKWSELPILMLSEHRDPDTIGQVFAVGADDYIDKPIIGPELVARILSRLERNEMRRRIAEIDSLTGLSNRRKSVQDFTRLLKLAKRQQKPLSFVILDLDYFKRINDKYGHDIGDKVLRQLGKVLKQYFRGEDVIGRWGGEEFALGLYGMNKQQGIARLNTVLEEWHKQEFRAAGNQKFQVTFSAGVATFPEDGSDLQTLYRVADTALYQAKKQGRNQVTG